MEQSLRMRVPDLIEDIHRKQKRRYTRRIVAAAVLLVTLACMGVATKVFADRQARQRLVDDARGQFALGSMKGLASAVGLLEGDPSPGEGDAVMARRALVLAQLWAEFGVSEDAARAAVGELELDSTVYDGTVAIGLVALAQGELAEATAAAERAAEQEDSESLAPSHHSWLAAAIALAQPSRAEIEKARQGIDAARQRRPNAAVFRRMEVALQVWAGRREQGLQNLEAAREQHRRHVGFAADEALYNAKFRQHIGGVASVAEQLLESPASLSPRDRAHAELAMSAVQIYSGEYKEGLALLRDVWSVLPRHDRVARNLAVKLAILSGDGTLASKWIDASGLGEAESEVLRAWVQLARGDIMGSLAALAKLPQADPQVAYLQGLALVEQGRFKEAGPWLLRADELMPGRLDIEVALARVQLHEGDAEAAIRKLEGLSEEESFAPRVWTGLGEAYLQLAKARDDDKDLGLAARRALESAVERERLPAEAMLLLAKWFDRSRRQNPEAPAQALAMFERAAQTNDNLPRYTEHLGLYLADLGHRTRALEVLRGIVTSPGLSPQTVVETIRLGIEAQPETGRPETEELETWFEHAKELGADARALRRERARWGLAQGGRENIQRALKLSDELLKQDPHDVEARVLFSQASLRLYERQQAEQTIRRGLQLGPDSRSGRLYHQWAQIESRTGARRKAAGHARVAWRKMRAENRPPHELLEAANLAVRQFIEVGKPAPAWAVGKEVTEVMPYHARAWVLRARAELSSKLAPTARRHALKAAELDPNEASAHAMVGHCHMRFGHKDKARAAYTRAVESARNLKQRKEYSDYLRRIPSQ